MVLSGILLTPTGQTLKKSHVKMIAKVTSEQVLQGTVSWFATDENGEYSVDCPFGTYSIVVVQTTGTLVIGIIVIDEDTTETNINDLILLGQTAASNPILQEIRQSVIDAEASATAAAESAEESQTVVTEHVLQLDPHMQYATKVTVSGVQDRLELSPSITDFWNQSDGVNWQPAFSRAVAAGKKRVLIPEGSYGLASTAFLPAGFIPVCESRDTTFFPLAGAVLTGGFLFQINTTDGVNWTTPYPNMNTGGFSNCQFDNRYGVSPARGIRCFGSGSFSQLSFTGYRQSIARPTGFYCDSFQLHDIICQNPQDNTEYQIDIQGLGDGFTAHDIHCPYTVATTSSVLAMRVRGVNGGTISDCIGGDYLVELSNDVNITGGHFERAQHIYDSANVTVSSQFNPDVRIPIITRGTFASANNESRFVVDLSNTTFRVIEGLMEWTGFHVSQGASVQLSMENTSQVWSVQGDFQRVQKSGIRICQEDLTTTIPSFNNYSYLTSKRAFVDIPNIVSLSHATRMADTSFVGISTTRVEPVGTRSAGVNQWKIAVGTYYYNVQVLYDTGRALGRNPTNSEASATAVLGSMVVNNVGFGTAPRNAIIRLYRGTSTGSYSHFVDIHTMGSTWLHDNGLSVNGVAWSTRTTGAMNTINNTGSYIRFNGSLIELTATAIPNSAGSFTQGDRVNKPDSVLDGNSMLLIGYHRLTTGSGGVLGTDWANMRVSHVSPSI